MTAKAPADLESGRIVSFYLILSRHETVVPYRRHLRHEVRNDVA